MRIVLEGSIVLRVAAGSISLGPGDRVELAPGEPHAMTVGPQGARYLAGTRR